ncbi:MAG TPA: fatty acid--CoA ligase family protein [Acidimicrobiales bacterium]|nr:fatty acid--CoA ligase family protein [Acidimicrobiales bacterium]
MVAGWRGRDDPAVVASGTCWSGRELLERSAGAAAWLRQACPPGAVPALLAASPAAVAHLIGGADCGRPLAPLGPRLTAAELAPCIEPIDGDVILADPEFEAVAEEVGALTGRRVERLRVPPRSADPLALDPEPEAPAFWLHTSGTTGRPKAVPYTQWRLARRSRLNAELCALEPGAVYASASGFHHIAGLGNYVVALAAGAALAPMARFSVESWRALADLHVTHALTVPTMLEMLLEADALVLPDLRNLQYGAAPVHPDTLRRTLQTVPHVRVVNIYGQTEGSPITCLTAEDHRQIAELHRDDLLLSVGRAVPGVELRIDEPDASGVGEIVARADHLFVRDSAGWLRTGDFGRLDDEGYLYLSGRRGDKIIRGGENIYPLEVERILEQHPGVREAAVVGVPDRKWGEILRAVVVPSDPDKAPALDDLKVFVRSHLAGFKVPAEWVIAPELPRNANGKLLRRALGESVR